MHQTFYIDVDEEISSVIDRLHKSMSQENYFVVPKRALFLQSVVNLKILKREADKMSKRVVIVTQDEMVEAMAERSGLATRPSIESFNNEPSGKNNASDKFEEDGEKEVEALSLTANNKSNRLKSLGSGEFYETQASQVKSPRRSSVSTAIKSRKTVKVRPEKILLSDNVQKSHHMAGVAVSHQRRKNELDPHKAQVLEKIYSNEKHGHEAQKHEHSSANVGSLKVMKFFTAFVVICIFMLAGVGGYLYLPSAKVTIGTDIGKKKFDMEIVATDGQSADPNSKMVGLEIVEKQESFSFFYDATGTTEVVGKKAHGKLTIYNEYSEEPQTLIATTRFESENGKIFRLVKNVIVPGMSNVGGQIKPGVIEVDVVADKAGSDYNIEAIKFKIPGFSGGPKYDKFYAASDSAMLGGSGEGQDSSAAKVVTQQDLDDAKKKAENSFKEQILQAVKDEIADSKILLDPAVTVTISDSTTSQKKGTESEKVEWKVSGSAKALVFNENDIEKIILEENSEDSSAPNKTKKEIAKIDYGSVETDFEKKQLKVRVYSEVNIIPLVDKDKIKKEILGKNDNQLAEILRKYPAIKNANVEFSPSFITSIPNYESRVELEVKNEAK